ncbi:MAG: RDD family protein [SAR324 cluster bacterium]|nr:RDD family protein [SAR324 cluster bacterium]
MEEINTQFKVASSHRRTVAFLIDFFLFIFISRVTFLAFLYPDKWDLLEFTDIVYFNIYYYASFFIFYLAKDFWRGQSFGKWLFKIRVTYVKDGLPYAKFFTCWVRNLFLLLFPLEVAFFLFGKLHRRLGDRFMGTLTIVSKTPWALRDLTSRLLMGLLVASFLWGSYLLTTPSMIAKSSFYHQALQNLAEDDKKDLISQPYKIDYFKELYPEKGLMVLILGLELTTKEHQLIKWLFKFDEISQTWKILSVKYLNESNG